MEAELTLELNGRPARDGGLLRCSRGVLACEFERHLGARNDRNGARTPRKLAGEDACATSQPLGSRCAFTLIEVIGVLAVIGLLAAALVPALIRQMDRIAGDQESAALKACGDALQQSVIRNRYVPGAADWATNIAVELGENISNVMTNGRKQPRFFLIDPMWQIGSNANAGQ